MTARMTCRDATLLYSLIAATASFLCIHIPRSGAAAESKGKQRPKAAKMGLTIRPYLGETMHSHTRSKAMRMHKHGMCTGGPTPPPTRPPYTPRLGEVAMMPTKTQATMNAEPLPS